MEFKYERKINYYETDKMGVVHHSNYIRFLEEARCRWMDNKDISMEKIEELGITIPTLEINCKYKYHVTSGDTIIITPKIIEFNGVRMTILYKMIDKKTGKEVIEAGSKHCFTDKTLKPINLKKNYEEVYIKFHDLVENDIKKFENQ